MIVYHLEVAMKEAGKLGAETFFQTASDLLTGYGWEYLTRKRLVRPFDGRGMDDVYEVATGRYRTAFVVRRGDEAWIIAFFKKEGGKLKLSELERIRIRAEIIRKNII
jgi:hypothetical protein